MCSLKHKVGDKVWVGFVVVEVDSRDRNWPYRLQSDDGEECWMSEDVVQARSLPVNISVNNVQVGDVVTKQGKFYTVYTVEDDRVCVAPACVYLLKKDIEAIYRNVYTKKKCVGEMTREELLEYVKQLEIK